MMSLLLFSLSKGILAVVDIENNDQLTGYHSLRCYQR